MTSYDINKSKSDATLAPPLSTSASIKYIGVSNTTSVASAGTETVLAKKKVPEVSKFVTPADVKLDFTIDNDTSAAFVPSTFAHVILLIFKSLFDDTVNKVVVVVAVKLKPTDSPLIVATFTIFGFAIIYSFYPKTIAIAIAFPVDIPKVDVDVNPRVPAPSVVTKA